MESIILMGIKHSGKSTQGRLLGEKLSLPFYDTDTVIFELTGKSPREIYTESGEEEFKLAEENACKEIKRRLTQDGSKKAAVIATGGGICNNASALAALKPLGVFVLLNASEKVSADRIVREAHKEADGTFTNLPAYIAKSSPHSEAEIRSLFHEFYEERTRLYSGIADVSVKTDSPSGPSPKQVNAGRILSALRARAK